MPGYLRQPSLVDAPTPAYQPTALDLPQPVQVQNVAQSSTVSQTPTLDAMGTGQAGGGGGPNQPTTGEVLANPVSVAPSSSGVEMVDDSGQPIRDLYPSNRVIVLTQPNMHFDEYDATNTETVEDRRVAVLASNGVDEDGRPRYIRAYVDDNQLESYDDNRSEGIETGESGLPSLGADSQELPFTTGEDIVEPPTTTVTLPPGSDGGLTLTGLDGTPIASLPQDSEVIVLTQPAVHYDDYMLGEGDNAILNPEIPATDRMAMVVWTDANGVMHTGFVDDANLAGYPDNRSAGIESDAAVDGPELTTEPTSVFADEPETTEVANELLNADGTMSTGEAIESPPTAQVRPAGDSAIVHDAQGNPIGTLPDNASVTVLTQPTVHVDDLTPETPAADQQVIVSWVDADGATHLGYLSDRDLSEYGDNRVPATEGSDGSFDISGVHLPYGTADNQGAIRYDQWDHVDNEFDFDVVPFTGGANPQIQSAAPGEVVFVKDSSGQEDAAWDYNNLIVVAHTNPDDPDDVVYSWYAHGEQDSTAQIWDEDLGAMRPLQPGDWVDQGDPLMQQGTTGASSVDHIHFAMTSDAPDFDQFYDANGEVPADQQVWYDNDDLLDVSFAEQPGELPLSQGYCYDANGVSGPNAYCSTNSIPLPDPSSGGSMTWDRDGDGVPATLSHDATGPSPTQPTVGAEQTATPETGTALDQPQEVFVTPGTQVTTSSGTAVSVGTTTNLQVITAPNDNGQSLVTWVDATGTQRTGYLAVP